MTAAAGSRVGQNRITDVEAWSGRCVKPTAQHALADTGELLGRHRLRIGRADDQIGLVFENLRQPPKAAEMYQKIVDRHNEAKSAGDAAGDAAAGPTETLLTIVELARWRKEFLAWESKAQAANKQLEPSLKPVESASGSAPGT